MKCPRCQNEDPSWFYKGSNGWYCRKCISFGRAMAEEEMKPVSLKERTRGSEEYILLFPLTEQQKEISDECAKLSSDKDVLLKCVCGAGKTEMIVKTVALHLSKGEKVCIAIARRQVVLEVAQRLQVYFRHARVTAVCAGYTDVTDGDLIVCTTHQLYRYYNAFDLLILDEPDAFPFRGNDVLHGVAKSAVKGHIVYLTATPDEVLKQKIKEGSLICLSLNSRPHGYPLPVPLIRTGPLPYLFVLLVLWLKKRRDRPCIVFVPTIRMASLLAKILGSVFDTSYVTSLTEERDDVIDRFRSQKEGIIVATTVLERGVTIPHVNVVVWMAENRVFDEAGLVQMAGRAGRSFDDPYGEVLFLCREKSEICMKCRKDLVKANEEVSVVRERTSGSGIV